MPEVLLLAAVVLGALILGGRAYLRWQASIEPPPRELLFALAEGERPAGSDLLRLEGAANFRDLGGYITGDGRRVAMGRVYRADHLSRLTDADLQALSALGLRLICDLRSDMEVTASPDRLPPDVTYRRMPVFAKEPFSLAGVLLARHRLDHSLKRLYREFIIDRGAPVLGSLLKLVAQPDNLPLVFHCTSGKDRTGMAAALLLHICGVPRATIVFDYSLTNLAVDGILAGLRESFASRGAPPGLRIEQLYPLFSARPELIELAFAHIEARYGSVDAYLCGPVGLTDAELRAIRDNLLI